MYYYKEIGGFSVLDFFVTGRPVFEPGVHRCKDIGIHVVDVRPSGHSITQIRQFTAESRNVIEIDFVHQRYHNRVGNTQISHHSIDKIIGLGRLLLLFFLRHYRLDLYAEILTLIPLHSVVLEIYI